MSSFNNSKSNVYINNPQEKSSSRWDGFLKLYFFLGYYTCFIPFKAQVNSSEGVYHLKTWNPQKLLSLVVVWGLTWVHHISFVINQIGFFLATKSLNPKHYIWVALRFLFLVKHFQFFWLITRKSEKIEEFLTLIHKRSSSSRSSPWKWVVFYMVFLHFAYISIILGSTVFYDDYEAQFMTHIKTFSKLVENGSRRFGFEVDIHFLGFVEIALVAAALLNKFLVEIFFYGTLPFTLWCDAKSFQAFYLSPSSTEKGSHALLQQFNEMKHLSHTANRIWANTALVWIIEMSTTMVMFLTSSVSSRKIVSSLVTTSISGFLVVALILMAETARVIPCFREWLLKRENRERLFQDKHEWEMFMVELEDHPVGIGSVGRYHINYEFLAELFVVALTIFVVSFEKGDLESE
ncbi:unnamed protein product [Orchesella dallaii]|uniref:Gustatory receptor n=1 Tax=Orchesella dallaii TaxID=48710 RepID=A0ABP1R642_9HEXA